MILFGILVFMICIVQDRQNLLQCQAPKLKFCHYCALRVYVGTAYGTQL